MSPLWAEKKLVHFLSIWGPIILSHGHINSATEKARALAAEPSPLFTVPGAIQQGSRFPSSAGEQDWVSLGVRSKRKGGKGTFFSMLVTFTVELNSPQLGRMENSDSLSHSWNNESHHPWRAGWLWLWGPAGEPCLAEWLFTGQGRERAKGKRSQQWTEGWAQSSVPKGSQAGFLGPPECQGARGLARSLAPVAGNHSAMRIKTSRGPCAALGRFLFPLWERSRFQTAFKHNTVSSKEEMKPFKSSVLHVVPSPAAFKLHRSLLL